MFLAVWMLCFVLGALAYLEPRSRVLLALLALVAVQTAYADWIDTDRLTQIFARLPIDFVAGECQHLRSCRLHLAWPLCPC